MTDLVLAVDVGGTKIDAALVTAAGGIVLGSQSRRATGPDIDAEGLAAAVADVCAHAMAALPTGATLRGAGVGSAGPLRRGIGTITPVNLPGVHGFALVDAVARALAEAGTPGPVRLGHDGECLALAEARWGAAQDAAFSLSIVVSTGIGGGLVIGGAPVHGANGNAGHIGQTRADAGGETLERIASGPASVAWARALGWRGHDGVALGRDAAGGDATARAAIERSAAAVGASLANVTTLLDLDVIVIGGGFSRSAPDYVELVAAALRRSAALDYAKEVDVVCSALGDAAPLVGAAALLLSEQ